MAKVDREQAVIYRVWCAAAGGSHENAEEIGAVDAKTAARLHAERLERAGKWPNCRDGRDPFLTSYVCVDWPDSPGIEKFLVARDMEPVFRVL